MKLKVIVATLCLLVLTITAISAIGYYNAARRAAVQENHQHSLHLVMETSERIDALLQEPRRLLGLLATEEQVIAGLTAPTPAPNQAVRQLLAKFQAKLPGAVIFLLDRHGNFLADANDRQGATPAGRDYAFHPYFRQAMLDKDSAFPAVGINHGRKGIFLSHPVRERSGNGVIGVAIAKLPLDQFGGIIDPDRYQGIAALTTADDLIFLSNRPELDNQFLWQLPPPEKLALLAQSRQFGPGPWAWSGFRETGQHQASDPEGRNYTIHHHPIASLPGWNLTYLHDNQKFAAQLSARLGREIGLFLAVILLLVGFFVFLLYRLAGREIRERRGLEEELRLNQQRLEEQVLERTTALKTSNQELLQETASHRKAAEELARSNRTKELLNRTLGLAMQSPTLQDFLSSFMEQTAAFAQMGLLPKGALFLVADDDPGYLQLKAHYGMEESQVSTCRRVKLGHCLCGRAAASGEVLFVNRIDERHDNTYEHIAPHGHYCIPILSPERQLIGLYNVYTQPEVPHDQQVEDFLVTIATALSGIIRFKQASQLVMESEEKHRAITNTAHEAIITVNQQGKATFWNPAATKIFGYTEEEALGTDLHQLISPARFLDKANHSFAHFVNTGEGQLVNQTVEITGRRKDGSEIDVELSLSALHHQEQWTALGILRDISGRKQSEKEKMQLQAQLRQAQKMEAIGTLAGGIAHDFNNILSSILGYAELVREELPASNPETIEDIEQVVKAGNRAKELVRQILTFSRQNPEELVPVQISLIVKEAIKLLRSSLPSSIEIRQVISDGSLTVFADPSQIHQVLMNLCTNSFKAMRDKGGVLEIRLEHFTANQIFSASYPELRATRFVCLVVHDTGIGMDSSILPRIFEPYFSTNKKEDGTGLGLAVVHGIVSSLGGTIEVASTVGTGSTFKVYLPIAENPEQPATLDAYDKLPQGSESILLVDDELPILELGSRILSNLGYQVACRASSLEALELFRNQPDRFDLVITDQNMPNMTGTRMADEIFGIRDDIPIILCTGYTDLNLSLHTRCRSIREIIMKPIAKSQLAATVRQVLDRSATSACQ